MPPQSGWGMGIDRIFALLTEQANIRDVILFPMMKPENALANIHDKRDALKIVSAVVNTGAELEARQVMNTVAHLSAAFGARSGKGLIAEDKIATNDNQLLPLNIQHAILIKQADNSAALLKLYEDARTAEMHVAVFTREMLETTNDTKIKEITAGKKLDDVELL